MLREKLHRPKERKRFEYSPSPSILNSPRHFPLSHIPISRTHACWYGVVIILAIRYVEIPADDEESARGTKAARLKSPFERGTGPSRLIPGFGRPGENRAARCSSRELPAWRARETGAIGTTGEPSFLRIGGSFRTGRIPRRISRVAAGHVPSERTNQPTTGRHP